MSTHDVYPPARRRVRRIAIGVALLIAAAGLILWSVRKPIVEHVIGRTLAARGVPARYAIADLGLGRQRLTNVVIGDPAHPDLVADWIETETGIGLSGPELAGLRIHHVRLRARVVNGRVSFGSLDRLLPPPSGKPFALPALAADIADARIRLETPQGLVGLRLSGAGRLDQGFRGSLAVVSAGLQVGACVTDRASAVLTIRTARTGTALEGPARLTALTCAGVMAHDLGAAFTATLGPALDRWRGMVRLGIAHVRSPAAHARQIMGTIGFAGNIRGTKGAVHLATQGFVARNVRGTALRLAGHYAMAGGTVRYDGTMGGQGLALPDNRFAPIARLTGQAAGTPVAPLLDQLTTALTAAGKRFDVDTTLRAAVAGGRPRVSVSRLAFHAPTGAQAVLVGSVGYDGAQLVLDRASGRIAGGGLPDGLLRIQRSPRGITAQVEVKPFAAGAARLTLAPVRIAVAEGAARVVTEAVLSGPLASGHIDGLTIPIDLRWNGTLLIDPACAPVGFQRLAVAGLVLAPARFMLCPVNGALVRGANVAARSGPVTLGGTLGRSPLALTAAGGRIDAQGFALHGAATRIGVADRSIRIAVADLTGRIAPGGVGGTFAGTSGQIGVVPLQLANAAGAWRFAKGRLVLTGALDVSDTERPVRFETLHARSVAFTLDGDRIAATAALYEPTASVKVANVAIAHGLASGAGRADLVVPALAFTPTFQPERLTSLTKGVIEEVRGTINGAAHIVWTADGVTSTGDFHTGGTDLAAAIGPATGIAGTIHFTDLLSLQSAPGQVASVKTINPGIPVNDGTIRYQTLSGAQVQVEGATWPFAGGTLTLDPTRLDFSQPAERRMTFHVTHVAADQFLQQFDFKNLDASGIFDGVLPMIFDARGGRIEGGVLAVREGGGTLAYVGEISQRNLGTWGNIAFQALKSLRYRSLEIGMNGALAGEMITEVRFAGVSQGRGAKSNFLIRPLQRLPFVFNIRIKAPFRGLLDSAQSFYDPKRLVQRNLPALLDEQDKRADPPGSAPIQPPASRIVP